MKNQEALDKAVIVVATIVIAALILLVAIARSAQGAEYRIYKNADGKIVLSNLPAPAGAKAEKEYQWTDVTWKEVRARQEVERWDWINLKLDELREKVVRVEGAIEKMRVERRERQQDPIAVLTGTSVGVTVKPVVVVPRAK